MVAQLNWNGGIAFIFLVGILLVVLPILDVGGTGKREWSAVAIGVAVIGYGIYCVLGAPWTNGEYYTVSIAWGKVIGVAVVLAVLVMWRAFKASGQQRGASPDQSSSMQAVAESTVATADTPPAGWYPDPTGRLRWWDGASWTEHVQ